MGLKMSQTALRLFGQTKKSIFQGKGNSFRAFTDDMLRVLQLWVTLARRAISQQSEVGRSLALDLCTVDPAAYQSKDNDKT